MMKNKDNSALPDVRLAKVFNFTSEDLAANRQGYMTTEQRLGLKSWERQFYKILTRLPVFKWMKNNQRQVFNVTGKIQKHFHSKIVYAGFSRGDQNVLEQRRIQVVAQDETVTFYVNEKQYNSLPENIKMTLYYDKLENRILSIEPPYDEEYRTGRE